MHRFKEEVLLGMNGKQSGIKLLVIGTVGAFNMRVLLRAGSMVLDNGTAKSRQEFLSSMSLPDFPQTLHPDPQ